ncbi:A disintegrin and metalloproteinase with thrombospondin motifs 9-like [Haliotis asinina]|uniref:A disintegrin and metalloproteinase with thrombospondin motifs 9-like n=1 Tax=Haliotis asinina TaxID=109174 RepID=UPI003531F2B3
MFAYSPGECLIDQSLQYNFTTLLRLEDLELKDAIAAICKMFLRYFTVLLFNQLPPCNGYSCTDFNSISTVQKDTVLLGSRFLTLPTTGVVSCGRQCLLRRRCRSFNVDLGKSECQLNERSTSGSVASNIVGVQNSVVSDIDQWPGRLAGECQNHSCPHNSVCMIQGSGVQTTGVQGTGPYCQTECSDPPRLTNGVVSPNTTRYEIGSTLSYSCSAGYLKNGKAVCQADGTWTNFNCEIGCQGLPTILHSIRESVSPTDLWPVGSSPNITCPPTTVQLGNVTCLSNGTWSTMTCRMMRSCSEVRNCSTLNGDGEYWIFPQIFHNVSVKIFCSGMNSGTPKHYVTLPRNTFSDYSDTNCRRDQFESCASVRYNKILIDDVNTMATGYNGLTDHTFANDSKCEVAEYAGAFDCSLDTSCTGNKGRQFRIDTGLTGLVVSPEIQWVVRSGYGNVTIQRSDNNRIINGHCVTNCSYCYANDDTIPYIPDESFVPSLSSAKVPIC